MTQSFSHSDPKCELGEVARLQSAPRPQQFAIEAVIPIESTSSLAHCLWPPNAVLVRRLGFSPYSFRLASFFMPCTC